MFTSFTLFCVVNIFRKLSIHHSMTWPARHPLTRNLSPVRVKAHLASGISPFLVLRWEVALRAAAHRVVVKIIPIKNVLTFWWFLKRWKVSCQLDDLLRRFHLDIPIWWRRLEEIWSSKFKLICYTANYMLENKQNKSSSLYYRSFIMT